MMCQFIKLSPDPAIQSKTYIYKMVEKLDLFRCSSSCCRGSSPRRSIPTSGETQRTRRWSSGCCRPGLVGFMVAALMAALMSSLAAAFNSASTLVTFDIYKVAEAGRDRSAARRRRPDRDRRDGRAQHALGAVHQVPELRGVHLSAERAGVHQPAHRGGLPRRRVLAARQSLRSHRRARRRRGARRRALPLRAESRRGVRLGSPLLTALVDINFLHFAILMFVISLVDPRGGVARHRA